MIFQNNDSEEIAPLSLKYDDTILIYAETNGRKVSAIEVSSGRILWTVDPFIDWNLKSYRFSNPVITSIKKEKKPGWIYIGFNSSQFGVIQLSNGKGYQGGQN